MRHRKATGGLASWWNGGGSSSGSTRLAAAIVLYLQRPQGDIDRQTVADSNSAAERSAVLLAGPGHAQS